MSAAWIADDERNPSEPPRRITALPDFSVSGGRVRGDVRAAFIDHADDAERRRHALEPQPVRLRPFRQNPADRIGQGRDRFDARGHALDPRRIEDQAVDIRLRRPGSARARHILGIGGQNPGRIPAQRLGHRNQRAVLRGAVGQGQDACGGARTAAHLREQDGNIPLAGTVWPSAEFFVAVANVMGQFVSQDQGTSIAERQDFGTPPALPENVRIGTSGWHYGTWRGPFYPETVRAKDQLAFYTSRFNSTEINNSFYRLPTAKAVRGWRRPRPRASSSPGRPRATSPISSG